MRNSKKYWGTIGFILFSLTLIYFYLFYEISSSYVIIHIRIPRFLLTFLAGFVLGGIGYAFQLMLNNPLAEPYILGISSGAAFGSILAAISGLFLLMPIFGFVGAILTMFLVWKLSHLGGFFNKTRLLLSGIIIGMFFSALISLLLYFHQEDIGNILNVLMGNPGRIFSNLEWKIFLFVFAISIILMSYLISLTHQLNILATGDLVAGSLGINVVNLRRGIFIISSVLTGIVVSYVGIIGFVGLIVPHLVRMLFGGNKRFGLFLSAIGGAALLILCDFIAQHILEIEIPVGIITAFLGCPFFLIIMIKSK